MEILWAYFFAGPFLQSIRRALSKIQLTKKCIRSLLIDDCSCLTVSPSLHSTRKRPWEILLSAVSTIEAPTRFFINHGKGWKWLKVDNKATREMEEKILTIKGKQYAKHVFTSIDAREGFYVDFVWLLHSWKHKFWV